MTAPTGLYGWIRSNDGRSTALFVGFLVAIQAIAALLLFLPLMLFDPDHAPLFGWAGYALRYAPLVLVASVVWFGAQMVWHIETVKRAVGFEFIDDSEEPRLCRLIEPLIIMMGLPVPYVGVIESPARNAFACGIGRKKAVVVVTRGLIDTLDDEELAAVLAHELSHIRNGDIRLMAAANIFMSALTRLHANNPLRLTLVHVVLALAVPVVLPLTLAGTFVGHVALRAGQVSRLLISSSREFIADAEAAQLTKNPAALAAALVKVEHDHHVAGTRTEDDAMMIAGETEGADATHPTVAQRIAALARVTGSMVFNAPSTPGFERAARAPAFAEAEAAALLRRLPPTRAIGRVRARAKENVLGLTRGGTILAAVAVLVLAVIHRGELTDPRAILAKFDVRPLSLVLTTPLACRLQPNGAQCRAAAEQGAYRDFEGQKNTLAGWLADLSRERRERGVVNADVTLTSLGQPAIVRRDFAGESGRMRGVMAEMTETGDFAIGTSAFSNRAPEALQVAEVDQVGCFPGRYMHGEPQGHYRVDQVVSGDVSIARYETLATSSLVPVGTPGTPGHDGWLKRYAATRENLLRASYDLFGLPGLDRLRRAYAGAGHERAVAALRDRLGDPAFLDGATAMSAAKIRALARRPEAFLPCRALRDGLSG